MRGESVGTSFSSTVTQSQSFTRPANVTPYASGQVIGTNPAANLAWGSVARAHGLGAVLLRALLLDEANQATLLASPELWLFKTAPTPIADGATFALSDVDAARVIDVVQFPSSFVSNAGVGVAGNVVFASGIVNVGLEADNTSTAIYGVLVCRSAYTPISGETFQIRLQLIQD